MADFKRDMAVAGDIVGISIPFTAGILAAAALPCGSALQVLACTGFTACALLFCGKGRRMVAAAGMFFFLGAICRFTAEMHVAPGAGLPAAEKAMQAFLKAIRNTGFKDGTTALLEALLTGHRDHIGKEVTAMFRTAGASHILALSGLHLGVIYGLIRYPLALLGNSRPAAIVRSILTVTAAGFYTLMAGAGPSIVRAFLFILLNEFGRHQPGRKRDPLHILCAALTIQLTLNPLAIDAIGFQLSYLAMLGIHLIHPRMEGWYPESRGFDPMRRIWSAMSMSISCQLTTAPMVWKTFGTLPRFFMLTNLIAMPLVELLIPCALLCIGLEAVWQCPDIMKSPVDLIARALIFCLRTISSM